jgi:FKBP-type peptidyl-prolyl cis-trans isomerase (trigger factor)
MDNLNDDFLKDFANDPDKYDKHLEELMEQIRKHMQETAAESSKRFLDRFGL